MLGSSGGLVASSGEGGTRGGGGEAVVGSSSSIMSGGIGDEENKGGGGEGGGEFFEGDRSTGGNRWPRQETLALLKIRSDMDAVFRDSSLKSPLWEEVSRKMAVLGYHRSSKKCKEKFENVYKYHKRTKDGRVGKSDGKTYRFFDQLEAFEQHQLSSSPLPPLPPATPRAQVQMTAQAAIPVSMVFPAGINSASVTVTSSSPHPVSIASTTPQHVHQSPVNVTAQVVHQQQSHHQQHNHHQSQVHHSSPIQMENVSYPSDTPSSSSTSSDEEELLGRRKRKRKWKDFFERLMKEVIDKQEQLQTRFLEAVEKREHDRLAREEVWKTQEMGRLNREHEILVQERSMASAKDAALIELLKKLSDHHQIPMPFPVDGVQIQTQTQVGGAPAVANAIAITTQSQPPPPSPIQAPTPTPPPQPQPQPVLQTRPVPQPQPQPQVTQVHVQDFPVSLAMPISIPVQPQPQPQPQPITHIPLQPAQQQALVIANTTNTNADIHESNNGRENHQHAGSSRWPKAEVQALINLRTKLDEKYQENGPKGPLWEDISTSMKELGYNRNAKRCKEKWENINKYFKKVKESNKKRPEDSKTCPYFHQLDALYRRKATYNPSTDATTYVTTKPENLNTMGPIMAQPDQHWHTGSGNDSEDDGDDDDDDDQGSGYEIVANNSNNNNGGNAGVHSMNTSTATATTTTTTAQ